MPHPFYMDVHVPSAVSNGLRRRHIDVLTAQQDGRSRADDLVLLQRATELGRIFFTQDEDLLTIATSLLSTGQPFSTVVYCEQRRLGIGPTIEELEVVATCLRIDEVRSHVYHLPIH